MLPNAIDDDDFPVIVAIDFGTTFSGCAYAYIPQDKVPKLIAEWPDQNMYYAKTPTLNLYQGSKGKRKMVAWGWSAKSRKKGPPSEFTQLYKYKPYLDEKFSQPPWTSPIPLSDAISDYIEALHKYAAAKIEQEIGNRFTREHFRYCLTVPAMWSDKAKDIMRQAAIKAKIITKDDHPDRLMLVTEPEAAALYCERSCKEYDLKHGDRFLICDAGGGTVDLIVYDVAVSAGGRTLSEVVKGHGATCGSMLVDMNFGNLLIKKFRNQGATIQNDIIANLVEKFAYELKPRFNGVDDLDLTLPWNKFFENIEDPGAIGIDEGTMSFRASELKSIVFDPVVDQVLNLIKDQLNKAKGCSAIFLVGGFGSSVYLLNRVKQRFGAKVKIISAPNRPEIAVVFGAVYAALEPKKITARATRRGYGVSVIKTFEAGIDPVALKIRRVEGEMCKSCYSAFVERGQLVKVNECITQEYCFTKQDYTSEDYRVSIYSIDGSSPRYVTGLSPSAYIRIPDPFASHHSAGSKIDFSLSFYFGLSEIQVEASIQGNTYVTRLHFDNNDSADLSKQVLFNRTREY